MAAKSHYPVIGAFITRRAIALLLLWVCASPAIASPFDCTHHHCGLITHGNNPDLVVGTVEATATAKQMQAVFHWARAHDYWSTLPADGRDYLGFVRLVSLKVHRRSVTVLMTREEYDASPFRPGALVRYSPHNAAHDAISYKNPAKEAYWRLVGCVAQLCPAKDKACRARYRLGLFDRQSGRQLSFLDRRPVANGLLINPNTLLPIKRNN